MTLTPCFSLCDFLLSVLLRHTHFLSVFPGCCELSGGKNTGPGNIFSLHLFGATADGDGGPSRCLPPKKNSKQASAWLRGCAHPERLRKLRIYFMDELKCVTAGMRRLCSPPVQNQRQLTAQIYFWASAAVLKKKTLCLSSRHNNSRVGGFFFFPSLQSLIYLLFT